MLARRVERRQTEHAGRAVLYTDAEHAHAGVRFASTALTWALVLLADLWLTFVLSRFAYTRPWGERSSAWLLDVLERFAPAALGAVPGC